MVKKYPSLKSELDRLFKELSTTPTLGISLGNNIYKIRIAIASKGRGKSGGGRVMSFVKVVDNVVLLFSIYDKSEKDSISDSEIKALIEREL